MYLPCLEPGMFPVLLAPSMVKLKCHLPMQAVFHPFSWSNPATVSRSASMGGVTQPSSPPWGNRERHA
jgi:hypothetical protein